MTDKSLKEDYISKSHLNNTGNNSAKKPTKSNIKIITWIWVTLVCFRLFAPTAAAIIEVSIVGIVKLIPPVLAGSTILDMLAICLKLKDKHCISHKQEFITKG